MVDPRPTIKNADMTEEMQQEAVECAVRAFEKYTVEKDIAAFMKKEFDKKYGATWHCIVGRNFGSYVTHGKDNRRAVFPLVKTKARFRSFPDL
jgi:dynein light chain LC8-type